MTIQKPSPFARLAARVRQGALTVALVGAITPVAMAAPLTQAFTIALAPSQIPKFNTNLGTLLSIDISMFALLAGINPFAAQVPRADTCSVAFSGGSVTVSAPGTPTLLSLDGTGSASGPCDRFEFGVSTAGSASVDPSLFGAFTSVGLVPFTPIVTAVAGTAIFTHGTDTLASAVFWHPGPSIGLLTYRYCPLGEDCSTPPPPPPPSVPEPTTAVMLSLGLAGTLARRRSRR